jgi:hypothetical protein
MQVFQRDIQQAGSSVTIKVLRVGGKMNSSNDLRPDHVQPAKEGMLCGMASVFGLSHEVGRLKNDTGGPEVLLIDVEDLRSRTQPHGALEMLVDWPERATWNYLWWLRNGRDGCILRRVSLVLSPQRGLDCFSLLIFWT